jgi:hypothetical protein
VVTVAEPNAREVELAHQVDAEYVKLSEQSETLEQAGERCREFFARKLAEYRDELTAPCTYVVPWSGPCRKVGCTEHRGKTCRVCGAPATHGCDYAGIQFVCGVPLCGGCGHVPSDEDGQGMFMMGHKHGRKAVADG